MLNKQSIKINAGDKNNAKYRLIFEDILNNYEFICLQERFKLLQTQKNFEGPSNKYF